MGTVDVERPSAAEKGRSFSRQSAYLWGPSQFRVCTRSAYQGTHEGLVDELGGDADGTQITRAQFELHLRGRYGHTSPATYNCRLATTSRLLWCEDQERIVDRSRLGSAAASPVGPGPLNARAWRSQLTTTRTGGNGDGYATK